MTVCYISIDIEGKSKEIDKFFVDFKRTIRPKMQRFEFPFSYERNENKLYLNFENSNRDCPYLIEFLRNHSKTNKFIKIECWINESQKEFFYLFKIRNGNSEFIDRTKAAHEVFYEKKQIEGIP
jgi:hypothetical protein